ncbi:hypothetical protein [Kitasatospora terrestris]
MAMTQKFSGFQVNRSMLGGGVVLTGLGAVIGLAGTALVCYSLASAGRGWMQQMDTPPSELAARAINQARAASLAGLEAWKAEGKASVN